MPCHGVCVSSPVVLAKKTSKNQVTLPDDVVKDFPGVDYFAVRTEDGRIILEPVAPSRADLVRQKLADLGIGEKDVQDSVAWARTR